MNEQLRTLELVFVTGVKSEADALLEQFHLLTAETAEVRVTSLAMDEVVGMISAEKVIVVVLTFASSVASGVLSNVVYDAFQASPTAQCVAAGSTAISKKDTTDKGNLEAVLQAASKPEGLVGTDTGQPPP